MLSEDPYELLGLSPEASSTEIHRAYRRKVFELHPDRNPSDAKAAERFQRVSAAYQYLKEHGWRVPPDAGAFRTQRAGEEASSSRPEFWKDGSRIHYPTQEEIDDLIKGAAVPKLTTRSRFFWFIFAVLGIYYFLEIVRGGPPGDGRYGPKFYEQQNKLPARHVP